MKNKIFKEIIIDGCPDMIIMSDVRPATKKEIVLARKKYKNTGECDCSLVIDEQYWLYDLRYCAICNKALGAI